MFFILGWGLGVQCQGFGVLGLRSIAKFSSWPSWRCRPLQISRPRSLGFGGGRTPLCTEASPKEREGERGRERERGGERERERKRESKRDRERESVRQRKRHVCVCVCVCVYVFVCGRGWVCV